ncbi:MAG: glycosyltransferase family 2 protein [Spirulina sp. SIO3F2]|nr:glycosyltransferase family 2 protein [Spirulina sp. SIO3F2]
MPVETVTIAIPTYNEAKHIEAVLTNFLSQGYRGLLEIFVADGGSTDGTPEIVEQIARRNSVVKLIHNPARRQANALNLILEVAKGDIFLRADAHCIYAEDYIENCVLTLLKSKALNVGGAQRFIANNAFQAGLVLASMSLLGNGGAKYRNPDYCGFADTVFIGCFWRDALLKVSGYRTDVGPNEDAELNQRLLQQQKNAVYISSNIRVWYYPRSSLSTLWIQYFRYGRGRYRSACLHKRRLPFRTKLPGLFLISSIVLSLILIYTSVWYFGIFVVLVLISFGLESIRLTCQSIKSFKIRFWRSSQDVPNLFLRFLYCWIALLVMPIAYSTGGFYQLLRSRILKVYGW